MTDDDVSAAIERLDAETESERLEAARTIAEYVSETGLNSGIERAVRRAIAAEPVPWVRGALAEILGAGMAALEDGVQISAPAWDEALSDVELDPQARRQLVNISTKRVLHEVAGVVGRARLAPYADLNGAYQGSETSRQLEFLSDVCSGLRSLTAATGAPSIEEFELSEMIEALSETASDEMVFPIEASGPKPFIVTADRGILQIALQNLLRNAVEASLAVGPADPSRTVVVTWGSSPGGSYVSVIDRGPGPPAFLAAVHKAGVSTKPGHPGYGLATATEGMRSLNGAVTMSRNDRGGATVVLTWEEEERA